MTSPEAAAILALPEEDRVAAVADLLRERNSLADDLADLHDIERANKRHLAELRKVLCGDRYSGSALLDIARDVVADADAARAERDRLLSILRDVSEALSGGEVPAEELARTVATVMHSNAAHLDRVAKERDDLRAALAPIKALDLDAPRCPDCLLTVPIVEHDGADRRYVAGHLNRWPHGCWWLICPNCGLDSHRSPVSSMATLRSTLPEPVLAAIVAAQGVTRG